MRKRRVILRQHDESDCGPACLAMIAGYYGLSISIARLRELAGTTRGGTNLLGMGRAAEALGLKAKIARTRYEELRKLTIPAILRIKKAGHHFVVLYSAKKNEVVLGDPAEGLQKLTPAAFSKIWTGIILLITPTPDWPRVASSQSSLKTLGSLLGKNIGPIMEAFFCACFCALLSLGLPVFLQLLVDDVLARRSLVVLNRLLIGLGVLLVFRELFGLVKQYLLVKVGQKVDLLVFLEYYRHLLRLPQRFYESHRSGELLSRFNDAFKIKMALGTILITVVLNSTLILFYTAVLFYYHTRLALIPLLSLPLFLIITSCFSKPLRNSTRQETASWGTLGGHLVETVHGISTLKLSAAESRARAKAESLLVEVSKLNWRSTGLSLTSACVSGLASVLGIISVLWYGGYLVIKGELSIGQLLAFYTLILGIFTSLKDLANLNHAVQDALVAADRVFEILDVSPNEPRKDHTVAPAIEGNIDLKNVSFEFAPGRQILREINLKIPIGTHVAIIGQSGAGKSTLCKLLAKLYEPTEGQILIDGYDIRDIDTSWLRRNLVIIGQDSTIFTGTVRENITLSKPEASLEEVMAAAVAANIHDFVMQLPDRYETRVGEHGMTLSSGQAQRILIARAWLLNSKILIFDEAMSNLDSESEAVIQENLLLGRRDRTTIVISHRMSTVRGADLIAVMANGRIVDIGKHEELCRSSEYYLDIFSRQTAL